MLRALTCMPVPAHAAPQSVSAGLQAGSSLNGAICEQQGEARGMLVAGEVASEAGGRG